ncbi:MAG: 1,4-dihydroxy-2-naphthoate polyprenyltransferase [Rubrobacter sp.]
MSAAGGRSVISEWFWLARPFTLTAAAVPVLFGTTLAAKDGFFSFGPFVAMLLASLLIQAATNMFNEFYDNERGLDSVESVGISGSIVKGHLTSRAVIIGALLCYTFALFLGLYLVWFGGWLILLLGCLSALGGYIYSAGPRPVAYTPASEVTVFLFMGVLIVVIAYAVQVTSIAPYVPLAALPIGGPVAAILLANNIRDMDSDRRGGRKTIPIVFGRSVAVWVYRLFLVEAYVVVALLVFSGVIGWPAILVFLSLPLLIKLWSGITSSKVPAQLDPVVKQTAGLHLVFGLLYTLGVLLG